jgi:hypothetical protein
MRLPHTTDLSEIEIGSHQRAHIQLSIPTLGMVPIEFCFAMSRMQMPINGQVFQHTVKIPMISNPVCKKGFEIATARNKCVEDLLSIPKEERPKWLFFLGDDMIAPWDGFVKLYEDASEKQWDCLTGLYYLKGEPPTQLTWRDDHVGRLKPGVHFKIGEVIWVDMTGLDFTLIRTKLLEEMEYPWFKTGPSLRGEMPDFIESFILGKESIVQHTEDTWFYGKAKKLGAKIGVHSGVRVAHYECRSGAIY